MAIDDRSDTIEEQPARYSHKAQRTGILMLSGLLVVLCIGTLYRIIGGTSEVVVTTSKVRTVDTGASPRKQESDFLNRLNRAEMSRSVTEPEPVVDVQRVDVREIQPQQTTSPQVVDIAAIPDPWTETELERVRKAQYDDYDLNLGFENGSRVSSPRSIDSAQAENDVLSVALANVQREIERTEGYKSAIVGQGARFLPSAGATPGAPLAPLEVGHAKSNSLKELPRPGQKLLPVTAVIRAVLDQKIVSDYVGPFRARIVDDVYDVSKRFVLIPKGSTVDGQSLRIGNVNEPIQARMALTVNWIVLPNGHKINFSRQFAMDGEGVSAIKDVVNRHFLAQFLGVAGYALLSSESSRGGSGLLIDDATIAGDIGQSAREQFAPLAQKYLGLVPTITLRAGTPLRIYIAEEIYTMPWSEVGENFVSRR